MHKCGSPCVIAIDSVDLAACRPADRPSLTPNRDRGGSFFHVPAPTFVTYTGFGPGDAGHHGSSRGR